MIASTSTDPLKTKLPARTHAAKLVAELVRLLSSDQRKGTHAVFLQACPSTCRDDTDREMKFHQEANFNYLTGAWDVASSSVLITFSLPTSNSNGATTHTLVPELTHNLFIPPADPLETMWSIAPPTLEDAEARFESDTYLPTTDLPSSLSSLLSGTESVTLHTLPLTTEFPPLPAPVSALISGDTPKDVLPITHSAELLRTALHIARLTKTPEEVARIRRANDITSQAHTVVMAELGRAAAVTNSGRLRNGQRTGFEPVALWEVESEADAEALFVATCKRNGGTDLAYLPIVASGTRASTLHYVCNDRLFPSTATPRSPGDTTFIPRRLARGCCGDVPDHTHDGDHDGGADQYHTMSFEPQVLLIDAGCEWQGYASDVTRTIPVGNGGKFTPRAAEIYDIVLEMQKSCEAMVKPGVHWDTIHLHAHIILIDHFLRLGIFRRTFSALSILNSGLSAIFFPHGLGHALGLDVHDSRQYLKSTPLDLPATSKETPAALYRYLRIRQTLVEGECLTVEPGVYFAPQLMSDGGVWEAPMIDQEVLKKYLAVGGVRIEDVVVVTKDGCENLTAVGREREWVERVCSGEKM